MQEQQLSFIDISAKEKNKKNIIIDILDKPTPNLVDFDRVQDAQKHIDLLHRDYDGNIALGIAQNKKDDYRQWNQYSFKSEDLKDIIYKFLGEENVYISVNAFWNYRRRLQDLRHLKAFVIDLDYYKIDGYKNKTQEQMWTYVKNKERYFFKKTGQPSCVINSGGGLYLMWFIESAHKNALSMWQLCMEELYKRFEKYGADNKAKDAAHVFRICGSKNSKNNNVVEFIDLDDNIKIYTLEHFRQILLPNQFEKYIPKKERDNIKDKKGKLKKLSKKELRGRQIANLYTVYMLHSTRIKDLEMLVKLRNGDMNGCREDLLFYYRYWSCCYTADKKKALEDILYLNNQFVEPLSVKEVIEATKSAEDYFDKWKETFDKFCELEKAQGVKMTQRQMNNFFYKEKCFIFTSEKVIKELSISEAEMKEMLTIISKKEKNFRSKDYRNEWKKEKNKELRRNEKGMTQKEQDKYDKMIIISEMLEQGYKQKDIAEKLKCDKGLVSKYKKELETGKYIIKKEVENNDEFERDILDIMA